MRNRVRLWIKYALSLYDISDLCVGGHCGCCGKGLPKEIFPKHWRWGLCSECIGGDSC